LIKESKNCARAGETKAESKSPATSSGHTAPMPALVDAPLIPAFLHRNRGKFKPWPGSSMQGARSRREPSGEVLWKSEQFENDVLVLSVVGQ
jgi:hypothetical protein